MDRKRIIAISIPAAIGFVSVLIILFLMTALSRHEVIVKDKTGGFYRASAVFIAGPLVIINRDSATFTTRNGAVQSKTADRDVSIMSMGSIEFIEVIDGGEEGGSWLGSWQPTLKDYIGDYTVNAAGNHGYLSLRASGSYVYGTIRFPDWGRGGTEYLKNARVVNGRLYFTRSISNQQELRRLGANAFFVQEYSGEYLRSGNLIRGFYTVQGTRKPWEAVKNR